MDAADGGAGASRAAPGQGTKSEEASAEDCRAEREGSGGKWLDGADRQEARRLDILERSQERVEGAGAEGGEVGARLWTALPLYVLPAAVEGGGGRHGGRRGGRGDLSSSEEGAGFLPES